MKDKILNTKLINDPWYSFRRFYVDKFFFSKSEIFNGNQSIIDIGGKKTNKRGVFDINEFNQHVKYANISEKTNPDYLCDATAIPVDNNAFDVAILAEVLEHVPNPTEVLSEAFRILKPDGTLFITVPFHFHIHADPYDYARYTDYWFFEKLKKIGFDKIIIKKQGLFYSVLANMIKLAYREHVKLNKLNKVKKKMYAMFVKWFIRKALIWDKKNFTERNWLFGGYTTGFEVICKKP